jgi:hypothetical protein
MTDDLNAEEVRALLKLEPHATCGQRRWFLGASTEWPGVENVNVEIGDVEALAAKHPDVADDLCAFQKGSGD